MNPPLGYCTNVHAGADLATTRANLARYAVAVKRIFSPDQPMGLGLWLSASAARGLLEESTGASVPNSRLLEFRDWLQTAGLIPFTFNGFPFGDFHGDIVKHQVYFPTWWEPARLDYTKQLIALQHALLPPGMAGSISTLPIAWNEPAPIHAQLLSAARALSEVARTLAQLTADTGRHITVNLEPEPGCYLQRAHDVVRFFQDYLFSGPDEAVARRHLGVCHDVCHAAVMFEDQAAVLQSYRAAGIQVGKLQVSSAVGVDFDPMDQNHRQAALAQLASFAEKRYLHQTMVRSHPDQEPRFFVDLDEALATHGHQPQGQWRTHFHVPIYLERFGHLDALQAALRQCLEIVQRVYTTNHLEVETYAWGVLPQELQVSDLASGIAREMTWLKQHLVQLK